jgi:hypothetical protein
MSEKKIVGSCELISLLDLELFDLDAKIDTGAQTCALHCDDIFLDDECNVHFTLLDKIHPAYHGKRLIMPLYKIKEVKSSNGLVQSRACIKVTVEFFGKRYKTIITLTNRTDMKYPMLIGKKFLENRFLVDVSQEYLCKKVNS